ncbi:9533_t:CDS:2 [Ambispora leptoticha]|uniref:9533_t:CDS:1 n=1 Tax=Ambispora leptoticha TaxID=144679 RepID=A0A9N9GZG0_9GLOM|nr:9533_t:CDS:2 [Ambispora leptoticha]
MNYSQRKEGNIIDKLWLTVENKKSILQERNVNGGTNCIQLVSCKSIHISNVGHNKRNYENDENKNSETPTKKLLVDNDNSSSENDKHGKYREDEEITSSEIPIVKTLMKIGGIARYRIEEEWLKLEWEWQKVEEMVAPENGELDEYQENLLKKI